MKEEKSKALFEAAKKRMPGGVNSPVRAYGKVGRVPRFIASAKGSKITDADGNEYIDYVCSWGPGILGHAYPEVVTALQQACEEGLSFGAPTEKEVILAEMIYEMMPEMEMVRLVSSGTEAVMSAIRVARGYTGRDKIVKFKGCYHGHSDGLLVKAGSAALTCAQPDSAGVPADYTRNTLVADYNEETSVEKLFEAYRGEIAAVIVEPVAANMGVVLPKPGFLEFLRKITEDNGALLIFDEVITGFRLSAGGAAAYYGIHPDLITLGKIVGGGMPIGAYGGRKEIMEMVSPIGPVYQAGTLSGNPIATTAGIATLTVLKNHPEIYQALEQKGACLEQAFREAFGEKAAVNRAGSLLSVFFTGDPVTDYESATKADTVRYAEYFSYMLDAGIYLAPSQYEAMFVSAAHTAEDLDKTCEAVRAYGQKSQNKY
jgi:glutamate-1-semialdehyde 2,1-aminomutase